MDNGYSAEDIEVLEGLEAVRRRPGMYIGGTDQAALHHLAAEILDNAMDEAVAGHADTIDLSLAPGNVLTLTDNGRGIPVDPHPKFPEKSALEVILTTLHAGGKFSGKAYATSGGLHGVGISVVNALSARLRVEVVRNRTGWSQDYARGIPTGPVQGMGTIHNRRGTLVRFCPDPDIFGPEARFQPARLYRMARSRAYLFRGVRIGWHCAAELLADGTPPRDRFHFPGGLVDYLGAGIADRRLVAGGIFSGDTPLAEGGRLEWAVCWPEDGEGFCRSYCNTIPTPAGGSHENGLRSALARGLRGYGERLGNRKAAQIVAEDVTDGAMAMLSLFIRDPQFQGQTKERLSMPEAGRLVDSRIKDHMDHWLSADPRGANALLERALDRAGDRLRRKAQRELLRKSATRRLRLPGKLADCTAGAAPGTEIFLVEGDSAGGSAKQARNRHTQAILPLRGKILNVASASRDKLRANQEINDLVQALGCGTGKDYRPEDLRYERVIVMTDADVDGAHIAALLMTFFFRELPQLVADGHLFLAAPPLYRLGRGGKIVYAADDADRDRLLATAFPGKGKVDISRFKGLGEMMAAQLRETTMDPARRTLLQVTLPAAPSVHPPDAPTSSGHSSGHGPAAGAGEPEEDVADLVDRLMGRKPEQRFAFIRDNARLVAEPDI